MDNKKKNINIEIIIFFYPILGLNNLLKESIIKKLLSKYNDIQNILDENKSDIIIKFLYNNKIIIHKIIYDEGKVIKIELNNYNNNMSFYFYLSLLISENKDIINYSYSIEYIKKINNERKNLKNQYKTIIISKFIIELINNYKGTNEYKESEKVQLNDIEIENEEIINNK